MCAVTPDLTKVVATYGSVYLAFTQGGFRKNTRQRYFGGKKVMTSSSLVDSTGSNLFYLTAHPDSMSKFRSGKPATNTVQIHNLQTNVVTAYPSVTVAERDTNIHHEFINKHLNKGVYQRDDGRRYKFYRKSE